MQPEKHRQSEHANSIAGASSGLMPDDAVEGQYNDRHDIRTMSAQITLWRDLCKYQRKSLKVGRSESGGGEEVSEEEEEEDEELQGDSDCEGDGSEPEEGRKGSRADSKATLGRLYASSAFSCPADVIRPFHVTPGRVTLSGHRLIFTRSPESHVDSLEESTEPGGSGGNDSNGEQGNRTQQDNYRWALRPAPNFSWPVSGLRRVLFRPYGDMRFAALEMWFRGGGADDEGGAEGSLLLGLASESLARELHKALRRARPPALEPFLGRLPATVVVRSKAATWGASAVRNSDVEAARMPLTEAWVSRRCGVTNFDYLRGLNAAAGRTTSDLSRYPIFPWVLSERALRAEGLDLTDERNFRDLKWPMGAQRLEQQEVRRRSVPWRPPFFFATDIGLAFGN